MTRGSRRSRARGRPVLPPRRGGTRRPCRRTRWCSPRARDRSTLSNSPDPVAILGPGEEGRLRPPKSLPGTLHGRGRRSGTPRPSRRTCRGQRPTRRGKQPAPTAPALGGCGTAGPQPDTPRSAEPWALAMDPDRPFGPLGARVLRCSPAGRGCGLGPHGGPAPREQCPDGVSPTDAWGFLPQCPSPGAGGRLGGVSFRDLQRLRPHLTHRATATQ